MSALLVGITLLLVLERTLTLRPTGPAPLWVSLLALGVGFGACWLVAAGLNLGTAGWARVRRDK